MIVELAQNAADAAEAAGQPGRLRLSLNRTADGLLLAAANTGAALDSAGVAALSSLRASAKRGSSADDVTRSSVGRFGVGFAAVLSVTDEPILLSHNGSIRFSRADTTELVRELGQAELTDEVRRRDGHLPVLRLPFEAEGDPPQGFSTVVLLPLRDDAAADLARRLLADVDDALLLALPALAEIEIDLEGEVRLLRDVGSRWHTVTSGGVFSPAEQRELFADRPTEESHRPWWSVLWALPTEPADVPQVVHAPTPTDEPMSWPALLLASFPLDPSRRHVAPGALTDRVVAEAATAYAELLRQRAEAGDDVLPLVPTGLGAGPVDAAVRLAALGVLRDAPVLLSVEDGRPVRPRDAVAIDAPGGLTRDVLLVLAPFVSGLVEVPVSGRTALRQLGVQSMSVADVIEALPLADDPVAWAGRYAALAPIAESADGREALGVLPVPLADGRVVRGPRGLLLPPPSMSAELLERLAGAGVRLVHPDAAHPLLARLGALPASPRQILDDAAVRELVATSPDADDPDEVATIVLGLAHAAVSDGALEPGDLAWLGDLALPDSDDELSPAAALAVPGSLAARLLDPDEIGLVATDLLDRYGAATLVAVGVLEGFAVVAADDVDLTDPPDELLDLDGFASWAGWVDEAVPGAVAGSVLAVGDLDAVRPDAWAEAVSALVNSPATRGAVVQRVRLRDRSGRGVDTTPYVAWWLRRELELDACVDPAGTAILLALLDPAPAWVAELDQEARAALGVVREIDDLTAGVVGVVLDRLADGSRPVPVGGLLQLWAWLSTMADMGELGELGELGESGELVEVDRPRLVRALGPVGPVVVAASQAVVADDPMWLQRSDIGPFVVAPSGQGTALADLFDLDLAADRADGVVTSSGTSAPLPVALIQAVPTVGVVDWCRHDDLRVDGEPVDWWVDGAGGVHARDLSGLAAGWAWASGRWSERFSLAAALAHPDRGDERLVQASFD